MSMINAVVYARFSGHGQTEQSIEGQLHDAYDFAAREGYTIIGEYIDRALTGRSDNRADFQRMIADSAKRQFSGIKEESLSLSKEEAELIEHFRSLNTTGRELAMSNIRIFAGNPDLQKEGQSASVI